MQSSTSEYKQINKQFINYVVPSVIALGVEALYTVLNGIIAGHGLGEVALGAINIALPFSMLTIALSLMIGIGGANVYSFYKGQGNAKKANNIFCQCLGLLAGIGFVLALGGFIFRKELAIFLGANGELLPYVTAYLKWMAPVSFFQVIIFGLIIFIRNDNAPRLVMVASIAGIAINAVLDVVLILFLHFGIEVIAVTNGIAVVVQGIIFIPHFALKKGMLRIHKPAFDSSDIKRILSNGFASFLMEFWLSALSFSYNLALVNTVGTMGVSAYSIVTYICSLIHMVLVGVTQGAQPIMSLYQGRKDRKGFLCIYRLGMRTNIIIPIVLAAGCAVFGREVASLFYSGDAELIDVTVHMLRLYSLGFIFVGPVLMNVLFFQTTERNVYAAIISFMRCIGFVQLFLFLSMAFIGANGIYLSFPAGELCHFLLSWVLVRRTMKKL